MKGSGFVQETLVLLSLWQPGMSSLELQRLAVSRGSLGRYTQYRTAEIVRRLFAPRFLTGSLPAALWLKILLEEGRPSAELRQLLLLYAARSQQILRDFIGRIYWQSSVQRREISLKETIDFLHAAENDGRIPGHWSDEVKKRVSRGLLRCLYDFDLTSANKNGVCRVLPFAPFPFTVEYLAHELHFRGAGDDGMLESEDWSLFGLDRRGTLEALGAASARGAFILQHAAELTRISWNFASMEEYCRGSS
jgi:hypothetical protein